MAKLLLILEEVSLNRETSDSLLGGTNTGSFIF